MAAPRQLCTFELAGLLLGIDVRQVQEVLADQPATRVPLAPAAVTGLMNLRGQIVTTLDLRRCLGLAPRPAEMPAMNVVVFAGDGPVSFLVDAAGDVLEVAETAFEPPPDTLRRQLRELVIGAY